MFRQLTNCIRRRVGPLGLAVVFAFLGAIGAQAAVINVSNSNPANLQNAINAAQPNDTLMVAPGTYSAISSGNKAITIIATDGPTATIITGSNATRCATLGTDASQTSTVLTGFTLLSGRMMSGNPNPAYGGGSFGGTLNRCIIRNCVVNSNWQSYGGGAYGGVLNNCLIYSNTANGYGGGTCGSILNNCTVYGNTNTGVLAGGTYGGGTQGGTIKNSIIWGNTVSGTGPLSDPNFSGGTITYSCSPNLTGTGNITSDPLFVAAGSNFKLQYSSRCIGAGDVSQVVGAEDIAGNERIAANGTVTMGAYEMGVDYFSNTWYVSQNGGNDNNDGMTWATAFATIQKAIAASAAGNTILVTNGTYGAIDSNNRAITIESVNGPTATIITGSNATRCATLGTDASQTDTVLTGFTLMNGRMASGNPNPAYGGGSFGGTLNRCIIRNCVVNSNWQSYGGGAYGGVLNNCLIYSNTANGYGGGTCGSILNNCTVYGNTNTGVLAGGTYGGGTQGGTIKNSIIWGNTVSGTGTLSDPNFSGGTITYSCAPSLTGTGNITSNPQFVAAGSDFRLNPSLSYCIDAGSNAAVVGDLDLAGKLRVYGVNVDMGAYECGAAYGAFFDANGGTGTMAPARIPGTLPANAFTAPEGKVFSGWATIARGAVEYAEGASVTISDRSITLYAVWGDIPKMNYALNLHVTETANVTASVTDMKMDFTGDRVIDQADLDLISAYYGRTDPVALAIADFNGDGEVDMADLIHVAQYTQPCDLGSAYPFAIYTVAAVPDAGCGVPGATYEGTALTFPVGAGSAQTTVKQAGKNFTVTVTRAANGTVVISGIPGGYVGVAQYITFASGPARVDYARNLHVTGASNGSATVTFMKGDVNGDEVISQADLEAILTVMDSTDPADLARADLSGDGVISIADLSILLKYITPVLGSAFELQVYTVTAVPDAGYAVSGATYEGTALTFPVGAGSAQTTVAQAGKNYTVTVARNAVGTVVVSGLPGGYVGVSQYIAFTYSAVPSPVPDNLDIDEDARTITHAGLDGVIDPANTAGSDDIVVRYPDSVDPADLYDPFGNLFIPEDASVTNSEGEPLSETVDIPAGTVITPGGVIVVPGENELVEVDNNGVATIPENGKVYVYEPPLKEIDIPDGHTGAIDPATPDRIDLTDEDGGDAGHIDIPSGIWVKPDDNGGGDHYVHPGLDGKFGTDDDLVIDGGVSGQPVIDHGNVIVPGDSKITDSDGNELTTPEGDGFGDSVVTPGGAIVTPGADGQTPAIDSDGVVTIPDDGRVFVYEPPVKELFIPEGHTGTIDPKTPKQIDLADDNGDPAGHIDIPTGIWVKPDGSIVVPDTSTEDVLDDTFIIKPADGEDPSWPGKYYDDGEYLVDVHPGNTITHDPEADGYPFVIPEVPGYPNDEYDYVFDPSVPEVRVIDPNTGDTVAIIDVPTGVIIIDDGDNQQILVPDPNGEDGDYFTFDPTDPNVKYPSDHGDNLVDVGPDTEIDYQPEGEDGYPFVVPVVPGFPADDFDYVFDPKIPGVLVIDPETGSTNAVINVPSGIIEILDPETGDPTLILVPDPNGEEGDYFTFDPTDPNVKYPSDHGDNLVDVGPETKIGYQPEGEDGYPFVVPVVPGFPADDFDYVFDPEIPGVIVIDPNTGSTNAVIHVPSGVIDILDPESGDTTLILVPDPNGDEGDYFTFDPTDPNVKYPSSYGDDLVDVGVGTDIGYLPEGENGYPFVVPEVPGYPNTDYDYVFDSNIPAVRVIDENGNTVVIIDVPSGVIVIDDGDDFAIIVPDTSTPDIDDDNFIIIPGTGDKPSFPSDHGEGLVDVHPGNVIDHDPGAGGYPYVVPALPDYPNELYDYVFDPSVPEVRVIDPSTGETVVIIDIPTGEITELFPLIITDIQIDGNQIRITVDNLRHGYPYGIYGHTELDRSKFVPMEHDPYTHDSGNGTSHTFVIDRPKTEVYFFHAASVTK